MHISLLVNSLEVPRKKKKRKLEKSFEMCDIFYIYISRVILEYSKEYINLFFFKFFVFKIYFSNFCVKFVLVFCFVVFFFFPERNKREIIPLESLWSCTLVYDIAEHNKEPLDGLL